MMTNRVWLKDFGTASISYSSGSSYSKGTVKSWGYQFSVSDGKNTILLDEEMTKGIVEFIHDKLDAD